MTISRHHHGKKSITLRVEGRLEAQSAERLEAECLTLLTSGHAVALDLAKVDDLDGRGAYVVRRLQDQRVRLTRCSRLVEEALLGEWTVQ